MLHATKRNRSRAFLSARHLSQFPETFSVSRASNQVRTSAGRSKEGNMGYLQDRDWDVQQKKMLRDEWFGGAVTLAFLALVAASLFFGPF
jgi:hypothetical protein